TNADPELHNEQSPHIRPQPAATLDIPSLGPQYKADYAGSPWRPSLPQSTEKDVTGEVFRLRRENDHYRQLSRENMDRVEHLERELRRAQRRSLGRTSQGHSSSMPLEARVLELEDIIKKQDQELQRMSELLAANMRTSRGKPSSSDDLQERVDALKGELSNAQSRAEEAEERAAQWELLEKSVSRVLARLTACVGGGLVAIAPRKNRSFQEGAEFVYVCVSLADVNVFTEPDDAEPLLSFSKASMKVVIVVSEGVSTSALHSQLQLFRCSHACGEPELVLRCRNPRETEKWIRLFKSVGIGVELVGTPLPSSGPSSRPSTPVSTRAFRTRQRLLHRNE
ncbi:hypothetical protein FOZ62_001750, partial [Perkinsus olseni]